MSRGHYGNGANGAARDLTGRENYGVRLGADGEAQRTSWWQIWVGLGLWIGVIAVAGAADAAQSAANALWAREEDRGWQKWLKASKEERSRWPAERAAWNAWEYEAQDIDDEALKTARKAAKKRP